MAKIVQVLTRPSEEYDLSTAEAQVRDLDVNCRKIKYNVSRRIKTRGRSSKLLFINGK